MEKREMLYIATKAFNKNWSIETLYYGDDMYGNEKLTEDVWEYVVELQGHGKIAFYKKYKQYKLY